MCQVKSTKLPTAGTVQKDENAVYLETIAKDKLDTKKNLVLQCKEKNHNIESAHLYSLL